MPLHIVFILCFVNERCMYWFFWDWKWLLCSLEHKLFWLFTNICNFGWKKKLKLVRFLPFLWFRLNIILKNLHLSLPSCLISYLNVVSWTIRLHPAIFFFFRLCGMVILFFGYNWLSIIYCLDCLLLSYHIFSDYCCIPN
jgi:hypothetical protein